MNSTTRRTIISLILGFSIGFLFSIRNGRDIQTSLLSALVFSLLVAVIVAVLSWSIEYAERKGYPGWLGFVLVLCLNVIGVLILFLLPERRAQAMN
ncbi:MAG: hypothetical protein P8074_20290 [Anaerolineales bacterium]